MTGAIVWMLLTAATAAGAEVVPSRVGEKPEYLQQPGEVHNEVIVGRARLLVSGKPVEFSAEARREAPIGRAICVNPAYRGHGRIGIYIPTICRATPLPKFDDMRVQVPDQGVKRYKLVIWGLMRGDAQVTAEYNGESAAGAGFHVSGSLANKVGTSKDFGIYVIELPVEAACDQIQLEAVRDGRRLRDRVMPKPRICP